MHGTCQNTDSKLHHLLSFDIITVSIIVSSLILFVIIVILAISIYILRRQRWKKHYHSSIDPVYKRRQQTNLPASSDYDNVMYGVFRHNVQLSPRIASANDEQITDTCPFTSPESPSYHPKIVFLGGEQQLTAIYA